MERRFAPGFVMDLSRLRAIFVLAGMCPTAGCVDLEGNQPTNTSATVGETIGDAGDTGQSTQTSSSGEGGSTSVASDSGWPMPTDGPSSGPMTDTEGTTGGGSGTSASSTTMPGETASGSSTGYGTTGYGTTGYYTTGYDYGLPDGAAPDDEDWFSQTLDCRPLDAYCRTGSARPHNL